MTLALTLGMLGLLLVFFVLVWTKSTRTRTVVTPFLLFGMFEIVSVWPALLFAQLSEGPEHGAYPALVAGLAFSALLLGFAVILAATGSRAEAPGAYRSSPVRLAQPEWIYMVTICVAGCILAAVGSYLYQGLPPLFAGLAALREGPNGLTNAIDIIAAGREEVTKGHYLGEAYRGQGAILGLMQVGWPYLLVLSSVVFLLTRRRRWLVLSLVLFVFNLYFIAGSAQRWQVLEILIYLGVTLTLVVRPTATWTAVILFSMVALYTGLSVLNSTYQGIGNKEDPAQSFATQALSRIALSNGINNVEAIDFVEDGSLDLGLGAIHLQKLVDSVPGVGKSDVPFSARLALLRNPYRADNDTTWASSTYLGWLYADLGLPGVVAIYLVIGGGLALAQHWLFRQPKTLLELPVLGFIIYFLGELALDGPATVMAMLVVVGTFYAMLRTCMFVPQGSPRVSSRAAPRLTTASGRHA